MYSIYFYYNQINNRNYVLIVTTDGRTDITGILGNHVEKLKTNLFKNTTKNY